MRARSAAILVAIVLLLALAVYTFVKDNPLVGPALYRKVNLGLDLQGGAHVVLQGVDTPQRPVTADAMKQALGIIRWRVDKLGVQEPIIQLQGDRRIIVELAGIKEPEKAVELIGRTALLEFKDEEGNIILSGDDLERADAEIDSRQQFIVNLDLKPHAKKAFAEATTRNYQKIIYIYLDDELVQAPRVEAPGIEDPIITGYQTLEEAQKVAMLLTSGALPVQMEVVENRSVSATLGMDSVRKSMVAGLIGLSAVFLFMLLYYRVPGLLADLALWLYILLVLGVLIGMKAVLTLPGIAGIILSIGMAVDANIIIFERVKEEIRSGKTLRSAVEAGFSRAFRTVLDANVTTLIGAGVLFFFGAGPIRGFAVTLSVGIITSMVTAVLITRYLLRLGMNAGLLRGTRSFVRA